MKINYEHKGDVLYSVETYRYRYQGTDTATIELLNFLGDEFAFQINMEEERIYKKYRDEKITSASVDLYKDLGLEIESISYESRQDALQEAIRVMNTICKYHSDIPERE